MLPFYLILFASFALPFLFLLEQLLLLMVLQLLAFWCCHSWGIPFLGYAIVLVYLGAIAILIVLSVLMMNLNRALTWHHAGMVAVSSLLAALISQQAIKLPGQVWFAPSYLGHWKSSALPRAIAEVWYQDFPVMTCTLAWLLCIVTLGIVQGVVNR